MYPAPLIIDIAGTHLSEDDKRRISHPLVGGLIYFSRNWENREQLTALSRAIKAIRPDLLIAVDHEGGRVQRFRSDGFTHLPPMRALGRMWSEDVGVKGRVRWNRHALAATRAATACGYVLASELRACGVDFSFTPVLDLDHGSSGVIGDRALAAHPRMVSALAASLMHGLLQAGMGNCGKHFPGHGFARADSHVAMPVDDRPLADILRRDAQPYRWLDHTLTAVMPAHVIYSQVDSRPAGFSSRWLEDILRGRLGFGGAIISDDLSMQGARQIEGRQLTPLDAVKTALDAGCDLALLCNQSLDGGQVLDDVLDGLSEAIVKGHWQPREASDLRRRALLPPGAPMEWDALMRSHRYMAALDVLATIPA